MEGRWADRLRRVVRTRGARSASTEVLDFQRLRRQCQVVAGVSHSSRKLTLQPQSCLRYPGLGGYSMLPSFEFGAVDSCGR